MQVSANRKQQITDELTRLGIEPDDSAIESVLAIMKANGRATVKSACRKYANQSCNANRNTTQKPVDGNIKDGLGALAGNLKDKWKKQVVSSAVVGLVKDLELGDYGELNSIADEELKNLIDADFTIVEACDIDPKYQLPSSESKLLLEAALSES